jgi:iron complex transport system ATP-binding protein
MPGRSTPETRISAVKLLLSGTLMRSDYRLMHLKRVSFVLVSAIFEFSDVVVRRGDREILGPINWNVNSGERWVILGPNGAGKTTLLQLCATLIHPTSGSVKILGNHLGKFDVFEIRTRIGITSSAFVRDFPEEEIVMDVVLTAAYAVIGRWQESYDLWDESRAKALLTALGVRELGDRVFSTLSEGEKKRVQIARSLMADPELLLLDEPASSLDLGGREDLLKRLENLAADPLAPATVIVTHHIEEIPVGTTHALLLRDGEVIAQGAVDRVLTDAFMTDAYGLRIAVQSEGGRYFARAI